ADVTGHAVIDVDDAAVLHVRVLIDGHDVGVTADGRKGPHAHARPERDVAGDIRKRMDERRRVAGGFSHGMVTARSIRGTQGRPARPHGAIQWRNTTTSTVRSAART